MGSDVCIVLLFSSLSHGGDDDVVSDTHRKERVILFDDASEISGGRE